MRGRTVFVVLLLTCSGSARAAGPEQEEWPKLLHTLKGFSYGLSFSPDSKTLAAGGLTLRGDLKNDRDIVLWDVATGKDAVRLKGQGGVVAVAFSPDGKLLAAGGDDLRLWDVERGKVVRSTKMEVLALAFSPDGKVLASGTRSDSKETINTVGLWDVGTLKSVAGPQFTREVKVLAFSPDGKALAYTGTGNGEIGLWDFDTRKERIRIDMGTQPKRILVSFPSITFSPDSKTLAVAVWYDVPRVPSPNPGWDQYDVNLWDTATGQFAGVFVGHERNVRAVSYAPNGKLLASAAGTLKIWDVASKKVLVTLKVAPDTIAFSPDGKLLATASRGGDIKLWSLERSK